MGVSREDTRWDRVRATRERRARISAAATTWQEAREYRRITRGDGDITRRPIGIAEVVMMPLIRHGVEFWLIAVRAAGNTVEYYTRMGEDSAFRLAERLEQKYSQVAGAAVPPADRIEIEP